MNRYRIVPVGTLDGGRKAAEFEDPNGKWVKWEDIEAELAQLHKVMENANTRHLEVQEELAEARKWDMRKTFDPVQIQEAERRRCVEVIEGLERFIWTSVGMDIKSLDGAVPWIKLRDAICAIKESHETPT